MSLQRYNFRSRSSSGESNSSLQSQNDPIDGVVTVPGHGFLTSDSLQLAGTIEEAEPVGEDAESLTDIIGDSPIPSTQVDLQRLDSSLQPKLLGCGTQVSDSAISQEISNLRSVSDFAVQSIPAPPTVQEPTECCPVCTLLCANGDDAVCCNTCDYWFHRQCIDMSSTIYAQLQNSSIAWFCHGCVPILDSQQASESSTQITEPLDDLTFGELSGSDALTEINNAYNTITQWRPNVFLTPSGHAGKDFLKTIKHLFDQFNSNGPLRPVALKLILLAGPLLLQKPSAKSKTRDHVQCLTRRLALWNEGNISGLIREGKTIQSRLQRSKAHSSPLKVFSRLMLKGQVSAALKWIKKNPSALLPFSDTVMEELHAKHPIPQEISDECTLHGPSELPDPILFEVIDANLIRRAAKLTRGSAGPSGLDSEAWGRILCSKHFKSAGTDLCESFARCVKILATEEVAHEHMAEFLCSRLVPLNKDPGIRPIGIGETLRRISGKCISMVLKNEVLEATSPLLTCGGVEGGVEASVHAVREMYMDPSTDCVLLVDASNAFNSLNRATALQNVGVLCPELYRYLTNIYGTASRMIISGTKQHILSAEGATQGCNLAMGFYGVGIMSLIHKLKERVPECKVSWYADDSAGAGKDIHVKQWWDSLQEYGPSVGYFPQPDKTCLIIKDSSKLEHYKTLFPDVQVTADGNRYLGSFIGTQPATELYVYKKVKEWVLDIEDISRVAHSEPQLAFAAYYFGIAKKWAYLMRTTPDIAPLLSPIEKSIRQQLLPALTGINPISDTLREAFSLTPKNGGLGIVNPMEIADLEYKFSTVINSGLIEAIVENIDICFHPDTNAINKAKRECKAEKNKAEEDKKFHLLNNCSKELGRQLALGSEKGASSWISTLPLKECGFTLSKQQFQDAIRIRYNIPLEGISSECACGKKNSIDHALTCKLGGYISLRHNHLRDTLSNLLGVVCKDVVSEPHLLPVTTEELPRGTTLKPDARLDISCRGFYSALDKTFIDVRVIHPNSLVNAQKPLKTMYHSHEKEKKTKYLHRVLQVEKANFTPFVLSTTGGLAPEATAFTKRLAQKLSQKLDQSYSNIMGYLRRKLRIELLKTILMAVRGYRKSKAVLISDLDLNLISSYVN